MALASFDRTRERVSQQANADTQAGGDALRRRLAATGMLNSGAGIQAQQQTQERGNQVKAGQLADVDAAENAELERRAEVAQGRQFQAGEAQKGRDFEGGFREKQFEFEKTSRLRALDQADRAQNLAQEESAFNRRLAIYDSGGLFGGKFKG
jgi:hypothetical protein